MVMPRRQVETGASPGALLAATGCTRHKIKALHGQSDPKTPEIHTRRSDRQKLVAPAIGRFDPGRIIG